MSRKLKPKTITEHRYCKCGYNCVEQYTIDNISHKALLSAGFKYRRFKDTGERFYFIYVHLDCEQGTFTHFEH